VGVPVSASPTTLRARYAEWQIERRQQAAREAEWAHWEAQWLRICRQHADGKVAVARATAEAISKYPGKDFYVMSSGAVIVG
jgi:aminoglycoside phosphotransferase (APT) family kinase protein